MKKYGEVDKESYVFLTSPLVTGEWSASRPDDFNFRKAPAFPIGLEGGGGQG
jgi:hypothetical protein